MHPSGATVPERTLPHFAYVGSIDDDTLSAAEGLGEENVLRDELAIVLTGNFYQDLGIDLAEFQQRYILHTGWIMLCLSFVAGTASVLVGLLASRIAAGVAANLRGDLFKKVSTFSNQEFDHFSTASLITRTTNDVNQIFILITMGMRMFFYAPIMAVGGISMAVRTSTSMSWIIALAVVMLLTLILIVFSLAMPRFKILQKLTDRLNLVSRENLTGLMVIRAFGIKNLKRRDMMRPILI